MSTLNKIKVAINTPTCFDSRRNHLQGVSQYLAKAIYMVFFLCACRWWCSQWYGGISACCAGVYTLWKQDEESSSCLHRVYTPAQRADMPPYHWLRHHRRAHKKKTIYIALAKHWETPWRWFLREPKHVGVFIVTLILFRVDATSNVH